VLHQGLGTMVKKGDIRQTDAIHAGGHPLFTRPPYQARDIDQ
jgi:hypothetical protein